MKFEVNNVQAMSAEQVHVHVYTNNEDVVKHVSGCIRVNRGDVTYLYL